MDASYGYGKSDDRRTKKYREVIFCLVLLFNIMFLDLDCFSKARVDKLIPTFTKTQINWLWYK